MALYISCIHRYFLYTKDIFLLSSSFLLFCPHLGIKKCLQTPALLSVLQFYVVQWVYISSLQELELFLEPKTLINAIRTEGGGENPGTPPPLLLPFTHKKTFRRPLHENSWHYRTFRCGCPYKEKISRICFNLPSGALF